MGAILLLQFGSLHLVVCSGSTEVEPVVMCWCAFPLGPPGGDRPQLRREEQGLDRKITEHSACLQKLKSKQNNKIFLKVVQLEFEI